MVNSSESNIKLISIFSSNKFAIYREFLSNFYTYARLLHFLLFIG